MTKPQKQDMAGPVGSPSKVPLPPSSLSTTTALPDLLATLSDRLAETEMSIDFLLDSAIPLTEQIESFPLLDRAKFCVTLNYAIDSLIFCYLRAKGTNLKDHPVMTELERVKIYIRKLNSAEQVPTERNIVLDRQAAQRMILHSVPKDARNPPKANEEPLPSYQPETGRKRNSEASSEQPHKKKKKSKGRNSSETNLGKKDKKEKKKQKS